ncbi:MAG TPA: glutathione transferase GstA [Polyangiaceae bacterium]|nr:glutathione transferase GstA [Polyangiaceae bacterium]
MTLQLFYSPGSCSLSPHIALREAGLHFELVRVDLRAKRTASDVDFLSINPKGYVPALLLGDGELITEGAIIVQYIADQVPDARLAPRAGTPERRRLQEWLHFIATELQKGISPLNNPKANDELKAALRPKLDSRFALLSRALRDRPYLLGNDFSVADGYAYYVLRSLRKLDPEALQRDETLLAYFQRLEARPAIQSALTAEGLL